MALWHCDYNIMAWWDCKIGAVTMETVWQIPQKIENGTIVIQQFHLRYPKEMETLT